VPESELLERLSEFSELGLFLLGVVYLLVRYFPWDKVARSVFGMGSKSSSKPPPSGESVADAVLRRFNEEQERKQVALDTRDHTKRMADALTQINGKLTKSLDAQTEGQRLNAERHEQTTTLITSLAELIDQAQQERA